MSFRHRSRPRRHRRHRAWRPRRTPAPRRTVALRSRGLRRRRRRLSTMLVRLVLSEIIVEFYGEQYCQCACWYFRKSYFFIDVVHLRANLEVFIVHTRLKVCRMLIRRSCVHVNYLYFFCVRRDDCNRLSRYLGPTPCGGAHILSYHVRLAKFDCSFYLSSLSLLDHVALSLVLTLDCRLR